MPHKPATQSAGILLQHQEMGFYMVLQLELLSCYPASSELSILASSSHIAPLTAQCNIYLPLDCSIDHVICDKVSCLDSLAAAASAAEKVMLCSDQPLRLPAWLFMPPAADSPIGNRHVHAFGRHSSSSFSWSM